MMTQCWLDVRATGDLTKEICEEALHQGLDAIVSDDPDLLATLPPTVLRVLITDDPEQTADVIVTTGEPPGTGPRWGRYVEVTGPETLAVACASAARDAYTLLRFADPTYIPLEIVLASAAGAAGTIVTVAADPQDAAVQHAVLEHGPHGVLLAPARVGDATRLRAAVRTPTAELPLVPLRVTAVTHAGPGDRACVDTCTMLRPDEGILIGSRSRGLVLCASETHPLPYMPTRPFRVNAGAIMSYTLVSAERTAYLSELRAGGRVLAVSADGRTRPVTVGRIKIETRPLLSIDAVAPGGEPVNLIVQDDWHVRVLGPGGAVLNSTALRPGDEILGCLPDADRHVGYPIDETCVEQ
ncbi:3-dehydroquinate synthase II family protein [Catenuloplanes indicus]|uniref:3-amino-4-hydroxybenzoic acid synthase n=1 Tax=Catenuloplanes indicus TaxID=137267 RepID=A0AAE3W799_9ACTN|nr:3-dehydroquinate synthase II family protein [Catenuloplanes indicus]MDQ0369745.1 3-amino-4-hydroxybenzoic acid synthase [Catenuloplanes indicus]